MENHKFENKKLQGIYDAMVDIDAEKTPKLAEEAFHDGNDVLKIVDALTKGINKVGDQFEAMERFLPELIIAAGIMDEAMAFLRPELEKLDLDNGISGTVVVANLQGDIHDIGRKIASVMLKASGFVLHDLGSDVKPDVIIDKAVELNADVIGLSSLLTTSLPFAKDTLSLLKERGLRDRFKVVMGGGAVTPDYTEAIQADGYCKDAAHAVRVVSEIIRGK